MSKLLLALIVLLPSIAGAQSIFPYTNRHGAEPAGSGDPQKLSERKAFDTAKRDHSGPMGLVPDAFRQPADDTDDAPSVQRAVTAACAGAGRRLEFQGRHYRLASPIVQPCLVSWYGQGWQEQPIGVDLTGASLSGTWLDFQAGAFGPSGTTNPVTLSSPLAAGSVIQGFGVSQPVAMPAPADTTWTPADTPSLIKAENVSGGVHFRDIFCRGVNKCLDSHVSGRTSFWNIGGQAWRALIQVDKSYDASRFDDIHVWPYYSTDARIMAFQQANAAGIYSLKNDTPLFGRLFIFGVNAGVLFDGSGAEGSLPGGTTTGATIEAASCDFVRHCLLGTAAAFGVQVQIGQLRTFGQRWNTTDAEVAARTGMLAGSDAIWIAGPAGVVQVGNLENYGTSDTTIRLTHATPSAVQVGSAYLISTRMSANSTIATMTGGAHAVTLSMPPMVTSDTPSGWANANLGGSGTIAWPSTVTRN